MENKALMFWKMMCMLFPIIAVWGGSFVLSLAQSKPFNMSSELLPRIGQTFLAALPFVFLFHFVRRQINSLSHQAIKGARWAGVGVLLFSTSLWGVYYYDSARASGGVNIGLGILLLFSPLVSLVVMAAFFEIGRICNRPKS